MKFLTINICPPNYCAKAVKKMLQNISCEERKERIISLIQDCGPDVIFFTEEWYPVFKLVREELEPDYRFELPDGFDPAKTYKGRYISFSGVIAAVKSDITVTSTSGKEYVVLDGRWLSLSIGSHKYLGVHYPQPTNRYDTPNKGFYDFHAQVEKFAEQEKPVAIIGDFNTLQGTATTITGYKDLLPAHEPTSAFNTKLDYIFLSETCGDAKAELIPSAINSDTLFSDHAATMVTL